MPGWTNIDAVGLPGVDVVADLDGCRDTQLPFSNDSVDSFMLSHVIEHIRDTLPLMQELHRIAKPGAILIARTPYGSSDDACEDPTHVRQYFIQSWGYFSQPYYWRADYGYRGDWQPETMDLIVDKALQPLDPSEILQRVFSTRNVVKEMIVNLRAVKPIREPLRELQKLPSINFIFA
jgi:SAM-dependent methyltransferase